MSERAALRDEYLANPSGWPLDAVATLLAPVETRGPTVIRRGRVHWKMQPEIPCPRCERWLERGEVTLTFRHAPPSSREQRVQGYVCGCGEYYVPGKTARDAHHRAFAEWLANPERRIPSLEDRARVLLRPAPVEDGSSEDRYEAALLLHECIRLESDRLRRSEQVAKEAPLALQRICVWACAARDPKTATGAWQWLTDAAEPPEKLGALVESLAQEFVAGLDRVRVGSVVHGGLLKPMRELAHCFPGDAQVWEHLADLERTETAREEALIRAARLKGIVGIEERTSISVGEAVPLTLAGEVAVSPNRAA